jgi:drug/metabolite transporter (DMT)-like permease
LRVTNPPPSSAQPDQSGDNLKAIILMAFSMVLFAFDDAAIKAAGNLGAISASPGEILIIKGVLGIIVYGALMWREGNRMTPTLLRGMAADKAIVWRTLGDLLAAGAIVTALTLMPLSNVAAILQVLPLVVTLGAALVLGEAVGWRRWSAILVGFAGVMIIIRPGTSGYDINTIWALLAVAGLAIRDLAARRMQARFSTFSIVTMVSALLIPTGLAMHTIMEGKPLFAQIAPTAWAYIIGGGFFGMAGYYAITLSTRMGELSAVAPYRYTRLVAALILAYIFFGEVPDMWMILGATLVIGAGLFTLYRERKLRVAKLQPG